MPMQWLRRAAAAALLVVAVAGPAAALARDFATVAVIPDTQNYVDHRKPQPDSLATFKAETRYLVDHREALHLAFVTHVGDVVQHGDGTSGTSHDATYGAGAEWTRAAEALDVLAASGVPFGMTPGNHDYDSYSWTAGSAPLTGSSMWRKHFGSASPYFAHRRWYGGASDGLAVNPGLSSYQTFEAGGRAFLHISLEMEAGDAAIAWAQAVLDAHRGWPTIVTTHAYLDPPADGDPSPPLAVPATLVAASPRYLKGSPGGWNDAQGVWEKLIGKNDQIFMVLCGHAWGTSVDGVSKSENLRIDLNQAGHPVYQLLTDYQGNTKASAGGDGWLRLIELDFTASALHFRTYSPVLGKHAGQGGEASFNQDPRFSEFTLPMPVQIRDAHGRCEKHEPHEHARP